MSRPLKWDGLLFAAFSKRTPKTRRCNYFKRFQHLRANRPSQEHNGVLRVAGGGGGGSRSRSASAAVSVWRGREGGIKRWSRQAQMASSAREMGQDKSDNSSGGSRRRVFFSSPPCKHNKTRQSSLLSGGESVGLSAVITRHPHFGPEAIRRI